jgi:hypothetical protein
MRPRIRPRVKNARAKALHIRRPRQPPSCALFHFPGRRRRHVMKVKTSTKAGAGKADLVNSIVD